MSSLPSPIRSTLSAAVRGVFVKAGGVYGRVDAATMALGMNVAWINSWSGAWVFSNLMYHSELTRASGTGAWTQDQGLVTTTDQNDVFRFKLADLDTSLPAGTYTVLNPDGLPVQTGGYSPPGTWRTDTQFTFERASNGQAQCLFVKGDVTNAYGNLAVIAPGHLSKWQAGNVWHDDFIEFQQGISCNPLRLMDWSRASTNIEALWSQRSVTTKPTLFTYAANGPCVPYEFMCDLASRLNTDIWVCVPNRASQDYVNQMAALFSAHMPVGRKLWLELGNEIWNTADPWGDGTEWINHLDHTRRTAAADVAGQKFVLASHGLSNAAQVRSFATIENRSAGADQASGWQLRLGAGSYVKVLNVNEFELYAEASLTTKITIPENQVNHLFVVVAEAGKSAAINTHYGEVSLRNWDAFDAALGASRVHHLVAAQAASTATTAGRLAVSGVSARADSVAIAPYFSGSWYGTRVTAASGSLTVGIWAGGNITVNVGIYAAGSNPSAFEVVGGIGAIAAQTITYSAGGSDYTNAAALTGLTNDTTYEVHLVVTVDGLMEHLEIAGTPSIAGSVGYLEPSYEQQGVRNTQNSVEEGTAYVAGHIAAGGSVPVICYEGGLHYHNAAPARMDSWLAAYQESEEFAAAIRADLQLLADAGSKTHCYYGDCLGTSFSIATNYADITDKRYLVYGDLKGRIVKRKLLGVADVLATNIEVDPGTFPTTVAVFSRADLTYTLVSGDAKGNYTLVGNVLQMVNDSQVNWAAPTNVALVVEASDGYTKDFFKVLFATGSAWYALDAKFAWDSVVDTDNTVINPVIGNSLPRTSGSTYAPIVDSLWDMDSLSYSSGTAMPTAFVFSRPLLLAAVLDKDNHTGAYVSVLNAGAPNFISFYTNGSINTNFTARLYTSAAADSSYAKFAPTTPTGKHVYWAYWDGISTLTAGYDQLTGESATNATHASAGGSRDVIVGPSASSKMLHGSMIFLERAGLTLAQAKAIVAKMQTLHGIA